MHFIFFPANESIINYFQHSSDIRDLVRAKHPSSKIDHSNCILYMRISIQFVIFVLIIKVAKMVLYSAQYISQIIYSPTTFTTQ